MVDKTALIVGKLNYATIYSMIWFVQAIEVDSIATKTKKGS